MATGVLIIDGGRQLVIAPTESDATMFWSSAAAGTGSAYYRPDRMTAQQDFNGKANHQRIMALDMATHTVTAAVALGLGCLFELNSIIGHVAAIHGSKWRFSLKRFVVSLVRKKNEDLGDAVEDALDEK